MTQEDLKIEYDKYKNEFDIVKEEIGKQIVKTENYKGVFYEIFPFSYQRVGLKQGKLVENMHRIKSTNELYTYGFDTKNNIIEVREGIDIENEFYYQFLFHEKSMIKSLSFDNGKTLLNVSLYVLNDDAKVTNMFSKGRRGSHEEAYHYNNKGFLEKITIRQFDRNGNEGATLLHLFEYNSDSSLKTIIKSALGNNDYKEVIYPTNAK